MSETESAMRQKLQDAVARLIALDLETRRKEATMTPYRERREAGYYDDKPSSESLTKEELQTRLTALNQPTTGNKAELAQRLADAQK